LQRIFAAPSLPPQSSAHAVCEILQDKPLNRAPPHHKSHCMVCESRIGQFVCVLWGALLQRIFAAPSLPPQSSAHAVCEILQDKPLNRAPPHHQSHCMVCESRIGQCFCVVWDVLLPRIFADPSLPPQSSAHAVCEILQDKPLSRAPPHHQSHCMVCESRIGQCVCVVWGALLQRIFAAPSLPPQSSAHAVCEIMQDKPLNRVPPHHQSHCMVCE
jgi:hypothetical protein